MSFFNFLVSLLCSSRLLLYVFLSLQLGIDSLSEESADHERFQGAWEGYLIGHESDGKIKLTITGDSLHFERDKEFWFKTDFKLSEGVSPKQLHTKIKDCPTPDIIGHNVFAIYKFEKESLILVSGGESVEDLPKDFKGEDMLLYQFNKIKVPVK